MRRCRTLLLSLLASWLCVSPTLASHYSSNVFLNGQYRNEVASHPLETHSSANPSGNIFLEHAIISRQARPFQGPTYLPPVEYLKCSNGQQCVRQSQCQNGYFTQKLPNIPNCSPETDICCTYRPPPTTTTTTTTTPKPYVTCDRDSDCVEASDCVRGEIVATDYIRKQTTSRCYSPQVCCRMPSTTLTNDGYIFNIPKKEFPLPEPTKVQPSREPTPTNEYLPPTQPQPQPQPTQPAYRPQPTQPQPSYRPQPTQPAYRPQPSPVVPERPTQPPQPSQPSYRPQPTQPAYRPQPTQPAYRPQPTPSSTRPSNEYLPPSPTQSRNPQTPAPRPQPTQPAYRPQPTQPQPTYRPQPTQPAYRPQPTPAPSRPNNEYLPPSPTQPRVTQPPQRPQPTQPAYRPQPTQPTYRPQPTQPAYRPQPTPAPTKPKNEYLPPAPSQPRNPDRPYIPPVSSNEIDRVPQQSINNPVTDRPRRPKPQRGEDQLSPQIFPQVDVDVPKHFAKCASALLCTQENYCNAIGVISETPVDLSPAEAAFRVPLTDCLIPDTGAPGKCCRDSNYVDPWPVNLAGVCASRNKDTSPRGIRSIDANFAEIPWQTMILQESTKTLRCGGAIIGDEFVLTTAACVKGMTVPDVRIKAGEWELGKTSEPLPFQLVGARTIDIHPEYDPSSGANDMAIIRLDKRLEFASHIQPICISDEDPKPTERCVTTGWGQQALRAHQEGAIMHVTDTKPEDRSGCGADGSSVCSAPTYDSCEFDVGSALACGSGSSIRLKGIYSAENACGEGQAVRFSKPDVKWINTAFAQKNKAALLKRY